MRNPADALENLANCLRQMGPVAIAVSGGVDSMTLAVAAQRAIGNRVSMYHAVSPAVPTDATTRIQRHAARGEWALHIFDAGEFTDRRYRENPVDRCYYCKSNLYSAIAGRTDARIVSGTNTDDLGDYRPGLRAASENGVRHPYVEAGIDKQGVRDIARHLELDDLAELPAAPCLSSRVETGIAIHADTLASVYAAEQLLQRKLAPRTVRCRVRHSAIVVELDNETLEALTPAMRPVLARQIAAAFAAAGAAHQVEFSPYRMGSAFVRARDANGTTNV